MSNEGRLEDGQWTHGLDGTRLMLELGRKQVERFCFLGFSLVACWMTMKRVKTAGLITCKSISQSILGHIMDITKASSRLHEIVGYSTYIKRKMRDRIGLLLFCFMI